MTLLKNHRQFKRWALEHAPAAAEPQHYPCFAYVTGDEPRYLHAYDLSRMLEELSK